MTDRIPEALLARRTDQTVICGWRDPTMQRISDALRGGLMHYVSGSLPLADAGRLVTKLQSRFLQLTRDRRHAHRLKLAGEPRYKLIVFANRSGDEALFWLLTDRPEYPHERWRNAAERAQRITAYQWEAVQTTKSGTAQPVWTWAMTGEAFTAAKTEIKDAIRRGRHQQALALGDQSATWPGFAQVRTQQAALAKIFAGEWRRVRSDEPPQWPRLRYVQRLRTR